MRACGRWDAFGCVVGRGPRQGYPYSTTAIRGTPGFVAPVFDDPDPGALVHEVLRAAEEGNVSAADTLLRVE